MCKISIVSSQKCITQVVGYDIDCDNNGLCIFHSKDIGWKIQHDFWNCFLTLLYKLNTNTDIEILDFQNFVFVPSMHEMRKNVFGDFYLDFGHMEFSKIVNFNNSTFHGFAFFQGVKFHKQVYFENVYFKSADFNRTSFYRVGFKESTFDGFADFQKCEFKDHAYFDYCHFLKRVYFHDAVFHGHTSFTHAEFNGQTNFSNTSFPGKWTTDFSKIIVRRDSIVHFQGDSFECRLFCNCSKDKIFFRLNENDIEGKIIFDAVDIQKIREYEEILLLDKKKKIEINSYCGCSYRFIVSNIDERVKRNIYQTFMECFNRFLSNEYSLTFNICFHETVNGFEVEFHSKTFITKDRFHQIAQSFKKEFEQKIFKILKKDRELKHLLISDKNLERAVISKSNITAISEADLEIDVYAFLQKMKTYYSLGLIKRMNPYFDINLIG
jgi:uncharacterized protein YjbI with pentapeptide repeats